MNICQYVVHSDESTMGNIEQAHNNAIETKTEYLGDNDPGDENMSDQMLDNDSSDDIRYDLFVRHDIESSEPGIMSLDLDTFNAFSNQKSNVYFWQEYMCNVEEEICGGLCGIVWRSMFQRRLYDQTKITSLADARLMFNMTKHYKSNTDDQN